MKKTVTAVAVAAAVMGLTSVASSAEQDAACKLTIHKTDNTTITSPYVQQDIGGISDVIKSGGYVGKMSIKPGVLDNLRIEDIRDIHTVCELIDGTRIESIIKLQHSSGAEDTRG